MNILSNFFTDDLAIDLGTVNTLIYAPGRGVVLNEPSVVAVHKYTSEVLSVGAEAYKLLGREPHDTEVHRPIRGGTIDNFNVVEKMLVAFINRAGGQHRRTRLVIGVPGASTTLEQRSVRDAAREAKATRVDLVDEGLAAALGAGLDFNDEQAHLIVDIGGGTTNIAIVVAGAIVSSTSLAAAGNAMDEAIRDYVRAKYTMQIGERTAEQVKKEFGAARTKDFDMSLGERKLEVVGKDLATGAAKAIEITCAEICEALEPVITEIINGVRRAVEESQPDVTADIYRTGIILTGGGALLKGIAERLQQEVRLHVIVADEPLATVVNGAGRLLANPERLQRAAIREDIPAWQASEELVVNW
jgi:rod shape-determining protein MreB